MTEPPRASREHHGKLPSGSEAFAYALLWLVPAAGCTAGAFAVAVQGSLGWVLRLILVLAILGPGALALMLASDSFERGLSERMHGWTEQAFWFSTSMAVLAVVVVLGAFVSLKLPNEASLVHFLIDIAVGAVFGFLVGGATVFVIAIVGASLGAALYRLQLRRGAGAHAARWDARQHRRTDRSKHVLRGALLGSAGMLLSALATTATTTTTDTSVADAPAHVVTSAWVTVVLPLAVWFLAAGVVWRLYARAHTRKGDQAQLVPGDMLRHATRSTAIAVVLFIAGGWITATVLEQRAEGRLWSGSPHAVPQVHASPAQWASSSAFLAEEFEPHFWRTRDERWNPTSTSWYVAHSIVNNAAQSCNKSNTHETTGCRELHVSGLSCDVAEPATGCAPRGEAEAALYYRYCEGATCGKGAPQSPEWKMIQYWIFYNYDSLDAGLVRQWHQGDWEHVSVLVRRTGDVVQPVEVAFSEHCYGSRLPASRVEWEGTHPVSYVGKGSHANYSRPVSVPVREVRCALGLTPRYLGVAGLLLQPHLDGTRVEIPLDYAIGLRDRAERDVAIAPPRLVRLDETTYTASFLGKWGRDNRLALFGILPISGGGGPPAPRAQPAWYEPFKWMYCGPSWISAPPKTNEFCGRG